MPEEHNQEKILSAKYPLLFREKVACGVYFPVGWFDIVDELSEKLEKIISNLPREEQKDYVVEQIKQKFGTLRYYISKQTNEMTDLIQEAENLSGKICEDCGKEGKTQTLNTTAKTKNYVSNWGYVVTLCDKCVTSRKNKAKAIKLLDA